MQWPPAAPNDQALAGPQALAGFVQNYSYRKRQRSPCTLDVPLSDPDIDGERHSHKRYLSEIMASGLSLHMCLEEADMDKQDSGGAEAGPLGQQAPMASSPSPSPPPPALMGNSPVAGLTYSAQGPADVPMGSGWPGGGPLSNMPPSPRRSNSGTAGIPGHSPPPDPLSAFFNARSRADSRANPMLSPRGDRIRSMPEQSPASPTDGRFPLDLRKTALLRSLLMRTDEGMGAGAGGLAGAAAGAGDVVLPDETGMAWQVPLPSAQELLGQPGGQRALGPGQHLSGGSGLMGLPMGVPGNMRMSGAVPRIPLGPSVGLGGGGTDSGVRGMSTATGNASRSESLMEDTANSMDTSSTTGSSALDEEQSRRMSFQGTSSLGLDNAIAGALGGSGSVGIPSRHRSGSGSSGGGDPRLTPRARPLPMAPSGVAIAAGLPPRPLFGPSQGLPEATALPGLLGGGNAGRTGAQAPFAAQAAGAAAVGSHAAAGRGLFLQLPQDAPVRTQSPPGTLASSTPQHLPGAPMVDPAGMPPGLPTDPLATAVAAVATAGGVAAVGTIGLPPIPTSAIPRPSLSPMAAMAAGAGGPVTSACAASSQPSTTPSPRVSPTFDEQRLQQLRAKAAAASAKLVGELEDLGQYRSIAPQLVLSAAQGASLRQPPAQGGTAGMLQPHHRTGAPGLMGYTTGAAGVKLPGRKYSSDEGSGSHGGCDLAPFSL